MKGEISYHNPNWKVSSARWKETVKSKAVVAASLLFVRVTSSLTINVWIFNKHKIPRCFAGSICNCVVAVRIFEKQSSVWSDIPLYQAYSGCQTLFKFIARTRLPPHRIITITDLVIYPVKSAKGIQVKRAELTNLGFKYDRQWYLHSTLINLRPLAERCF